MVCDRRKELYHYKGDKAFIGAVMDAMIGSPAVFIEEVTAKC
jgi:hypothetical protein